VVTAFVIASAFVVARRWNRAGIATRDALVRA
jgi:hypothetical protein